MKPTAITPATREKDTAPSPQASVAADAVAPSIWRCIAVTAAAETELGLGVIHALLANEGAIVRGKVGACRAVRLDIKGDEVQRAAIKRRETAMVSRHIGIVPMLVIVIETVDGINRARNHRRQQLSPEKEV